MRRYFSKFRVQVFPRFQQTIPKLASGHVQISGTIQKRGERIGNVLRQGHQIWIVSGQVPFNAGGNGLRRDVPQFVQGWDEFPGWQNPGFLALAPRLLCRGIEGSNRFHRIAQKFDSNGIILRRGKNIYNPPPHTEFAWNFRQ